MKKDKWFSHLIFNITAFILKINELTLLILYVVILILNIIFIIMNFNLLYFITTPVLLILLILSITKAFYFNKCPLIFTVPYGEFKSFMDHYEIFDKQIFKLLFSVENPIFKILSSRIPKNFTVIIFDCSFNQYSYYFKDHKHCISIDSSKAPIHHIKAPNNSIFKKSGEDFIMNDFLSLNLDPKECFVIYIPLNKNSYEKLNRLIRDFFPNVFIIEPFLLNIDDY